MQKHPERHRAFLKAVKREVRLRSHEPPDVKPEPRDFRQRIPLGGTPGSPLDVARAAMFLASPLARYITGTTLMVDGGWSVHA